MVNLSGICFVFQNFNLFRMKRCTLPQPDMTGVDIIKLLNRCIYRDPAGVAYINLRPGILSIIFLSRDFKHTVDQVIRDRPCKGLFVMVETLRSDLFSR